MSGARRAKLLRNTPVSYLMIICIVPLLLAMMLIYGEMCIASYRDIISEHVKEELRLYTDTTASYLDSMLTEMVRVSYSVYSSQPLRRELQAIRMAGKPLSIMETMRIYNDIIDPLFTSINSPQRYVVRLYLVDDYLHADFSSIYRISMMPEGLPVETMLSGNSLNAYWNVGRYLPGGVSGMTGVNSALCFSRVIYATDMSPLAIVNTEINITPLEDLTAQMVEDRQGSAYAWALSDGQVVFKNGDPDTQYWSATSSVRGNSSLFSAGYSDQIIQKQSTVQRFMLLALAALLALVTSTLVALIMKFALARIQRVVRKFSDFDGITVSRPLEGRDEAARLDQAFSDLFIQYKYKVDEMYRLERASDAMRSHLLLSRINLHFLYNTLSAMRWSALGSGNNEVAGIVDSMVAFYRGVLGGGRDYATLDMELDTLKNYLDVYEFTYSGKVVFEKDVRDGAGRLFILKFLLQPILENALVHGRTDEGVTIHIMAWLSGDALAISVWNGGIAIDETVRKRLNAYNDYPVSRLRDASPNPSEKDSYGVFNIIARIRILYGEGFGLWHESPENGGTLARFMLPSFGEPPDKRTDL